MLVGVFHLFYWCNTLKLFRFQVTKNKQKRFFMSLKMQVQKYKNFLIPPNDFLANFGFSLAKVAKSQSLFHVSREFTRIFFSQSRKDAKAFPRITRIYTNLLERTLAISYWRLAKIKLRQPKAKG